MNSFKSLSMIATIAFTSLTLSACSLNINGLGKSIQPLGNTETKNYTFDSSKISGLELAAGVNVIYAPAESASTTTVTVETDEAMMPYVRVELDGSELNIYRKSDVSNGKIKINVKITGPSLSSWEMSSGSHLAVNGTVSTSSGVDIDTSSGASATFTSISAPRLSIDASSGSNVRVMGYDGGKLSAEASSGAMAEISGIKGASVSAEASSGGTVNLDGRAVATDFDSSSGGSIHSSKLKLTR